MAATLVESMLLRVEGDVSNLRRALAVGGTDLDRFAARAAQANVAASRGATAGAARSIAATGDAAKKAAFDVASLVPAFNGLAARAAGVDSTIGTLVGTIGSIGSAQVTGVVLAGTAIIGGAYALLTKKARETEAAAKKVREELDQLQNRGDVEGLEARARELQFGLPSKGVAGQTARGETFFKGSIEDLKRRITEGEKDIEAFSKTQGRVFVDRLKRDVQALRDQLKPLDDEIKGIQGRVASPGPSRPSTVTPTKVTEQAPGAVQKSAERATSELARFLEQTAAAVAKASTDMLDDVDVQLQQLEKDLADAQKAAATAGRSPAQAEALAATRRQQLQEQRQLLQVAQAAAEFEQRTTREQVAAREQATRQAEEQLRIARQARQDLQTLNDPTFGLPAPTDEDLARLNQYAQQLDALAKSIRLGDNDPLRKALETEAAAIRAYVKQVVGIDLPGAVRPAADHARSLAADIGRGARALLDAATAAGLLDANLASALQSAINLADNIAKVVATKGRDVGADLGAIASLVSLGRQLFGQSEADKAREKALTANTRAIERLTQRAGDLSGLTVSGGAFSAIQSAVGRAVAELSAVRGARVQITDPTALFEEMGVDFADVEAIASTLHITLDDTVESFRKLDQAMRVADFRAFADTWAGALADLDLLFDVDNVESPLAKLLAFADKARAASPLFASLLDGFDLGNDIGRTGARDAARRWLDQLLTGAFQDTAFLGDLSQGEAIEALRRFINGIDEVGASLAIAAPTMAAAATEAERLAGTMSVLAVALGDISAAAELLGTDATTQLQQTLAAYATAFPQFADRFRGLLDGLDLTTQEGFGTLKERLAKFFDDLTADGLTDTDRQIIGELTKILNTGRGILDATVQAGQQTATAIRAAGDAIATLAQQLDQATIDSRRLGDSPQTTTLNRAAPFLTNPVLNGITGLFDPNKADQVATALGKLRDVYREATGDLKEMVGQFIDFLLSLGEPSGTGGRTIGFSPEQIAAGNAKLAGHGFQTFEQAAIDPERPAYIPPEQWALMDQHDRERHLSGAFRAELRGASPQALSVGSQVAGISSVAGARIEDLAGTQVTLLRTLVSVQETAAGYLATLAATTLRPLPALQAPPTAALAALGGSGAGAFGAGATFNFYFDGVPMAEVPAAISAAAQAFASGAPAPGGGTGSFRWQRRSGGDRSVIGSLA